MAASEETFNDPFVAAIPSSGVVRETAELPTAAINVADLVAFDLDENPVIRYRHTLHGERLAARSVVQLRSAQIGAQVVVASEAGDLRRPIILGVLQNPAALEIAPSATPISATVDGERQVITAEREIVLRCGAASITLTRAGKVIIKGTYVLSRSSGYNKIKGAAVDIN